MVEWINICESIAASERFEKLRCCLVSYNSHSSVERRHVLTANNTTIP